MTDPTYYDRPVLKEPVWIWAVPAYFFAGGTAGAASVLSMVAEASGRAGLRNLARRGRVIAALGHVAGVGLLILDLGRPARFLNMLRVFRPTSPLSVGSWVLAVAAPSAVGAAVLEEAPGGWKRVGEAAGVVAGVLGFPMTGYTALVLSTTAIPVWQQARRTLPPLFVASAASSAASLLELADLGAEGHRVVHRFGVAAKVAELAAMGAMERSVGTVERVGRPMREGRSGALWRAAKVLTAVSLAGSVGARRWKPARLASGVLGTIGALTMRFAVFEAGKASAADPRATFHQQRSGRGGAEVTGRMAVAGA